MPTVQITQVKLELPDNANTAVICNHWRRMQKCDLPEAELKAFYSEHRGELQTGVAMGLLKQGELCWQKSRGYWL